MTFLWHDYETFGVNAAFDRPVQFAAIRTDENLDPVGKPMCWFARPMADSLPHPFACLVTGITPQLAAREGLREAEFARLIHEQMMLEGTCSVGYNSLRFDDQVSRHLFFRNLYDPYEREYKNGNSRWDLIDLVRMVYALRPDGIEWPEREPGVPSFRLEALTEANGIAHAGAHDALVDVEATIALARLIRQAQPRLFDWGLRMRDQRHVSTLLDYRSGEMVLHSSSRIPASRGCTSLVLPLAPVPDRPKETVVFDLMGDPAPLLELDVDELRDRVFTPGRDLPEGIERIPLKKIASNKVPMLAPAVTLTGVDQDRIGLDVERCSANAKQLSPYREMLTAKLMELFLPIPGAPAMDPDDSLYSGSFLGDADKAALARLRTMEPEELAGITPAFNDGRLSELLFRYRARNYPETLNGEEHERWEADRLGRLQDDSVPGRLGLKGFEAELQQARQERADCASSQAVLDQVEAWAVDLLKAR